MSTSFKLVNETRGKIPRAAFAAVKDAALGKNYKLTLIVTTPARIKKLNTIYRDIEKPTDILSFPVSKDGGEIYMSVSETKKEAKKFDRKYENFFAFLFIHGCVHLKGYDHGGTMEGIEAKLRNRFGI